MEKLDLVRLWIGLNHTLEVQVAPLHQHVGVAGPVYPQFSLGAVWWGGGSGGREGRGKKVNI